MVLVTSDHPTHHKLDLRVADIHSWNTEPPQKKIYKTISFVTLNAGHLKFDRECTF